MVLRTVGEINCPKHIAQVKQADAIAVATGLTALATSTIACGINTPWEKPQNTAPSINNTKLDGNNISKIAPTLKLSIATGSVYLFVIFVTIPRSRPITIWAPEKIPGYCAVSSQTSTQVHCYICSKCN